MKTTFPRIHFAKSLTQYLPRYIENVEEELDFPNEFFHDAANNRLLYISNVSGQAPPVSVEVPGLTELIIFNGRQGDLRSAAYTSAFG